MKLQATTWQTVGPFFSIGLERLYQFDLAGEGVVGERITVDGRVLDGNGEPIPDGVVEVWQANSNGKYAHPEDTQDKLLEPGFRGFGRIPTDDFGAFRFSTIKPGSVPGPDGTEQAPHLLILLTMRGLLRGLATRAYFAGDARNATDPILRLVPPDRRHTLMLQPVESQPHAWSWTIRMQGEFEETAFFEF